MPKTMKTWLSPREWDSEEGREEAERIIRRHLTASTRLPSGRRRVRVETAPWKR